MNWRSIWQHYPRAEQVYQREQRLTEAYRSVFTGHPSKNDQELVLTNLAYLTGFSMVSGPEVSDAELRTNEGKRTVFALIRSRINLSAQDLDALELAARREAAMVQSTQ